MERDPVCGRELDQKSARHESIYGGKVFRFDTLKCKQEFDSRPERFVSSPHEGKETLREAGEIGKKASETSRSYARDLLSSRKGYAADLAGSISKALHESSGSMKNDRPDLARYFERGANEADSISGYFRDRDADRIIDELEGYVKDRPGFAIGGAITAGFLVARFLKSANHQKQH